jgi:hypothetical protein
VGAYMSCAERAKLGMSAKEGLESDREEGRESRGGKGRYLWMLGKRRGGPWGALPDRGAAKPGGWRARTEITITANKRI